MIKTKFTPLALLVAAATAPVQAQVIMSEYIEGSSNNKAVELFNTSENAISLDGYTLSYYSNGGTDPSNTIELSGEIAAGGTYVIANSSAVDTVLNAAQLTIGGSWYNGDDAIVLRNGDTVLDSFGQVGFDPGSKWENNGVATQDKTLRRNIEVTTGRTTFDAEFDPSAEWVQFEKDDFSGLGSHSGDAGGGDGDDDKPEPLVCGDASTKINEIQGNTDESPLKDQVVTIEAVVTADLQEDNQLKGFFVQSLAADMDEDSMTSEGLFVYYKDVDVKVGDQVRVQGTVQEFYNATQLGNVTQLEVCGSADVQAQMLTLPVKEVSDLEAVEGMLVSLSQDMVVADTYNLGRYGEVGLATERLYQGTQVAMPGDAANALEAENTKKFLLMDDGSTVQNPEMIPYPSTGLDAYKTIRLGDTVTNLEGVIAYSFGQYRLNPTKAPTFNNTNERTEAPELKGEGDLRIASFNVLNYFNGDGQGGGFPTPRGADTAEELVRQEAKLVSAITALDADVIGLMELENDGFGEHSAVADLVKAINAESEYTYAYVDFNASQIGTDDITTGIIYRTDTVEEAGTASFTTAAPFDYSNRPPTAQSFRKLDNNEEFTVAVAHLKSKGCGSAEGDNADQGDGQGCWNAIRTEGANSFADWLATNPTGNDDADVILVGDMNAYAMEDPMRAFEDKGLSNVITHLDSNTLGYSYNYSGRLGSLDHAVASQSLLSKVTDATDWHINADEPRMLDYNTEYRTDAQIAELYADHAYRASDHDPVIIEVKTVAGEPPVDPRPVIAEGQHFTVDENTQLQTVIGMLDFSDADSAVTPVERFIVTGTNVITVNASGQLLVAGELDYEYDNRIEFMVQAQDSAGNLSEAVEVVVNVRDVKQGDDNDDDDSGSFGWLALFAAPLALLRRRTK
ncbi:MULTISPECIES: ExeM/NucH family extracellular endonuclease [unclassified Pseudoalteromonas]|uniref:ExeM/NucH family extracellular endonuclease n=1 Tax=unclassified Pseudoalteromonas TaxID=194690 RepID=UPI0020978C86|nr:ExeM/NucH family extracellular endonuclease [Pseudoalteromonas sp. XMcav2-N]MCO7190103.1 ExeM/NucH family extracellular endonuclease [Pseudoalteromonas sp. XMcav2-N]